MVLNLVIWATRNLVQVIDVPTGYVIHGQTLWTDKRHFSFIYVIIFKSRF